MSFGVMLLNLVLMLGPAPEAWQAEIHLDGLRSSEGEVYVFVYNYANQYPANPYRHFKFQKNVTDTKSEQYMFTLDGLEAGTYAVAVFDDENSNGRMDKFLGIPREGYGFSNDSKPRFFSLPTYEELLIEIKNDNADCIIKMRYTF